MRYCDTIFTLNRSTWPYILPIRKPIITLKLTNPLCFYFNWFWISEIIFIRVGLSISSNSFLPPIVTIAIRHYIICYYYDIFQTQPAAQNMKLIIGYIQNGISGSLSIWIVISYANLYKVITFLGVYLVWLFLSKD